MGKQHSYTPTGKEIGSRLVVARVHGNGQMDSLYGRNVEIVHCRTMKGIVCNGIQGARVRTRSLS
jgi:hypothetical protein